jgi:hypothetical protein
VQKVRASKTGKAFARHHYRLLFDSHPRIDSVLQNSGFRYGLLENAIAPFIFEKMGENSWESAILAMPLKRAVAGLKTAHLPKITLSFEFSVLTLTVPGLRLRKVQNTLCFYPPAPFSSSLTALFRMKIK